MNKLVWGIVGVLLAAASPLRAETVSFPEDGPVFKIDVPEGWAAKNESETALYLRPASETTGHFFAFLEVPAGEVSDEASATKYLESYRAKDLETLGVNVKDSMLFPVIEEALPNNLKGWSEYTEAFMKIKKGDLPQAKSYWTIVFSPDAKRYFLAVAFGKSGDSTANKEFLKKSIAAK